MFSLFDNLILMHKGRCIYFGPINGIPAYFGDRNFNIPNGFNTADWVISVAKTLKTEEDMVNKGFLQENVPLEYVEKNEIEGDEKEIEVAKPIGFSSFTTSVIELTKRQMRHFFRNSKFMILRFAMAIMGGKLHIFNLCRPSLNYARAAKPITFSCLYNYYSLTPIRCPNWSLPQWRRKTRFIY